MNGITFETLAAAYLKKGTPGTHARHTTSRQNKPQKAQATNSTTAAEKDAEIENMQPAEPQPIKLESDFFTAAELAALDRGEQIRTEDGNNAFFTTDYDGHAKLLFHLGTYRNGIPAGTNATYRGFMIDGKAYTDTAKLQEAIEAEIESQIKKRIPDTATALKRSIPEKINFYIENDWTKDAATQYYYQDKEPTLTLYHVYSQRHTPGDLIRWMEDRETFTAAEAERYIESHGEQIAEAYTKHDGLQKALAAIRADANHEAQQYKRIMETISDEKSVKILLSNGNTVKVEADAVKRIGYMGCISAYRVAASDRQYMDRNQYNREADIHAADIKAIYHGQRTLYQA